MPPLCSFIGWHNCGKTTLALAVLFHLRQAGHRIGVIKATSESGLVDQAPTTDTGRYAAAGAERVALCGPDGYMLHAQKPQSGPWPLLPHFHDLDLVLAEGFKHAPFVDKIEVRRQENGGPALYPQTPGVIALAGDFTETPPLPHFRLDQGRELASFIEARYLLPGPSGQQLTLHVQGKKLELGSVKERQCALWLRMLVAENGATLREGPIELRLNPTPASLPDSNNS